MWINHQLWINLQQDSAALSFVLHNLPVEACLSGIKRRNTINKGRQQPDETCFRMNCMFAWTTCCWLITKDFLLNFLGFVCLKVGSKITHDCRQMMRYKCFEVVSDKPTGSAWTDILIYCVWLQQWRCALFIILETNMEEVLRLHSLQINNELIFK